MSQVKIDLNNLDKSNWKTYRFDEIAKNISERVDPNNTDLTVYIGLEHIDSESLHIKRHGTPDDVNGTKLKFYKGDVIFGRRRAYQRKAGIATWDGFCSAHALVLRANPDVIDPELFPFFMHSDLFMNRAIDISVGSLSPTINWGTLKHQEFQLPPKDIQENLAELIRASDFLVQENSILNKKMEEYRLTYTESILERNDNTVKIMKLRDLLVNARLGGNYKNSDTDSGLPLIKMGNLGRGKIKLEGLQYIPESVKHDGNDLLEKGDLLFNTRNSLELVGKVSIWNNELPQALYNSNILKLSFNTSIISSNKYMNLVFNSRRGLSQLRSFAVGTTSVAAIYQPELMRFKVPVISKEKQNELTRNVDIIDESLDRNRRHISYLEKVKATLINKVF
ncbi:restriction endonuclease subunit S [Vibrio aestuarianus]|uniref:restriction endonuclease subunit S n=1 Tax=Vibrio aestuarianus TaxID=28171 RepID=UPI00237CE5FF|nr:restriction endonuclease subunit S [Vibrio aestuarianus]MDE1211540.1 restriction endonuclease subunit S [Vibrio aestuarianus]